MNKGYNGKVDIRDDIRLRFRLVMDRADRNAAELAERVLQPDRGERLKWTARTIFKTPPVLPKFQPKQMAIDSLIDEMLVEVPEQLY